MKPPTPFEDKIRPFFTPIILGAVSLSVLFFAAVPQFDQLKTDGQLLSDRKKSAHLLQAKLAVLQSLDESSQAVTVDTAVAALPLDEPFRQSLLNLDALLARHQINASQIKVESAADNLSIKIIGTAPMSSLQNFITDANQILPISAVAGIQASRVDNSTAASNSASAYSTEIIVQIFFKSPPKTIGRASDPLPQITADHLKTLNLLSRFEQIRPASTDDLESNLAGAPRLFPE